MLVGKVLGSVEGLAFRGYDSSLKESNSALSRFVAIAYLIVARTASILGLHSSVSDADFPPR